MNPNIAIKKIMTDQLITVTPNTALTEVQRLFQKHKFHHLLVVEPGEKLVGMISKEDLRLMSEKISSQTAGKTFTAKMLSGLIAKDIMTANPMELDPDDTIGLAADIFLANKFHALPIVEDNVLLGILTTHDLLKFCFQSAVEDDAND